MKERPILMSGPMVRASLEDRKTNTRRLKGLEEINERPDGWRLSEIHFQSSGHSIYLFRMVGQWKKGSQKLRVECPYTLHSRLWVRETFSADPLGGWGCPARYRADTNSVPFGGMTWKPSIFMPRWACRLELEIVDLRCERLQDITAADALAEGIDLPAMPANGKDCVNQFKILWDSINGKNHPWKSNPFVWVIVFKRVK